MIAFGTHDRGSFHRSFHRSWRWRWVWAARLAVQEMARRRRAPMLGVVAFALLVLGGATAGLSARALAPSRRDPLYDGGAPAAAGRTDLVAFLRDDLPASTREALVAALRRLPGVAGVRELGSEATLAEMRRELGARAAILDGVEDGFLPATLEIAVSPAGAASAGAEALAWRLRRMDGVSLVDAVQVPENRVAARPQVSRGRAGVLGLLLGLAVTVLAVVLAVTALGGRRSESSLLLGFGFTGGALALPGLLTGFACALGGVAVAAIAVLAGGRLAGRDGLRLVAELAAAPPVANPGGALSSVMIPAAAALGAVTFGAALGWWTARPGRRQVEELAGE